MLKNNKGITMAVLVVTVVVMVILVGVSISASDSLLTSVRMKNATANMILVKGKIDALYEDYTFNDTDKSEYIGKELTDDDVEFITECVPAAYWSSAHRDDWLKWDREILKEQGFAEGMVEGRIEQGETEHFYIVNYQLGEVIYTKGVKVETGERLYRLSDLVDDDMDRVTVKAEETNPGDPENP